MVLRESVSTPQHRAHILTSMEVPATLSPDGDVGVAPDASTLLLGHLKPFQQIGIRFLADDFVEFGAVVGHRTGAFGDDVIDLPRAITL